jgi:hypothetical protein
MGDAVDTLEIIFKDSLTCKEDDAKLVNLPESIHSVRRAESAFKLLGRHGEFIEYLRGQISRGGGGELLGVMTYLS